FIIVLFFGIQNANAFYVSIYQDAGFEFKTSRPTHFIIAGQGLGLENLTHEAAFTKALAIKKAYPNDQVLFISEYKLNASPTWNTEKIYTSEGQNPFLSVSNLVGYMLKFAYIKSFHMYSHANAPYGARLYEQERIGYFPRDRNTLMKLKNRFALDAFAIFYGCNTGWNLAKDISEAWGIPVAGSFTGTKFEKLGSDGYFYDLKDKGVKFAQANNGIPCKQGVCIRQKPQQTVYHGIAGAYEAPALNYYKFFCVGINSEKCFTGMAKSIFTTVSSFSKDPSVMTIEEYKILVADFLCPSRSAAEHQSCIHGLDSMNANDTNNSFYMSTKFGQLDADFISYKAKIYCNIIEKTHLISCQVKGALDKNVTTLSREFSAYLKGFELIELNQTSSRARLHN
ncbi:MAG: hypothetical protein WA160_09465, partial [Pseudobdellovibrio sp.]